MKNYFIGIVFLMFAFTVGAFPLVEVDIGEKIECEALLVDQMSTIYNVSINVQNEAWNLILLNEAEVEIAYGDLFILGQDKEMTVFEMDVLIEYSYNPSITKTNYIPTILRKGRKVDYYTSTSDISTTDDSGLLPLTYDYDQKANDIKNDKTDYRFLKLAGTENVI